MKLLRYGEPGAERPGLLDAAERDWLDAYHARVLAEVGPSLDGAARSWLAAACAPLAAT